MSEIPVIRLLNRVNDALESAEPGSAAWLDLVEFSDILILIGDSLISKDPCVRCGNPDFERMMLKAEMFSSERECLECGQVERFMVTGIS